MYNPAGRWISAPLAQSKKWHFFFFFFITLGLELSDTNVYEP